jgi:hypothetical protein
MVSEKIKQEELPSTLLDQIMVEVDLDHRYVRLTTQLEDCVAFLSFFLSSTSRMNGDTKLCTFIVEAMLVGADVWKEISCASVDREVCLKHLKSLISGMDERQNGAFHKLNDKYRAPLPKEHLEALKGFVKQAADVGLVVEVMRDMMDMLTSPMSTAPELKNNLYNIGRGDELYDMEWYVEGFPDDIKVESILEAYKAIKSMI